MLAALPYVNALTNGFTFDDVAIVATNPRIRSLGGIAHAFGSDWWDGRRPGTALYRPLTMASYSLDYALAKGSVPDPKPARLPDEAAVPFHVQNLLWHVAATVLLALLALEAFGDPALAYAAAALFAALPVHTEAVDGIVGRAELMSAAFALAALLAAIRALKDASARSALPWISGALTFLGLAAKEQAIVVPAIVLLFVGLLPAGDRRAMLRGKGFRLVMTALAIAVGGYLVLRVCVLGTLTGDVIDHTRIVVDNPVASATGPARLLTPLRVFGEALRVLLVPRTLSADYSYDQIPLRAVPDLATIACALALAAAVAGVVLFRRSASALAFGLGTFLISWLLTSNLLLVVGTIFGERLLYLPSAGLTLAAAATLLAAGRRWRVERLAWGLVAALVVAGGARTLARNRDWKDNASLFAAAAQASPRSCKALDSDAGEKLTAGRPREAAELARASLAIYPDYLAAASTLAKSLRALASDERDPAARQALRAQAAEHARRVVALASGDARNGEMLSDAWNVLGSLALDDGAAGEALASFDKSLASSPEYVPAIVGSGAALAMQAATVEDGAAKERLQQAARERFAQALALDPGNPEARKNAALMRPEDASAAANLHGLNGSRLLTERRLDEALAEFREAVRLQPRAARGYLGLGTVLAAQADAARDPKQRSHLADAAIEAFESALRAEPSDPTAHMNLGIIYMNYRRDPARVAAEFRAYLSGVPDAPQRARMEETIRQMDALAKPGASPTAR